MSQWSKLQSRLRDLFSPDVDLQIHCGVYRMKSQYGTTNLPRYWITLGKEIIWDYPRLIRERPQLGEKPLDWYPHNTDVSAISELLREYVDTPVDGLIGKEFVDDRWGLTNILKAADRRLGRRRLGILKRKIHNKAALRVLQERSEARSIDLRHNKSLQRTAGCEPVMRHPSA